MKQRTIKQVAKEYIEEVDDDGNRKIRVVTETTTWFSEEAGRHNPTKSTHVEYL